MKVQVNVLINKELNPLDLLEDGEVLVGSPEYENDDEGLDALTEEMIADRYRDQIDEGSESVDDLMESGEDYTVTVKIVDDQPTSCLWTEKLAPGQVSFMNEIIEQIPETLGARDIFVGCLQKLAEAQ